MFARPSIILRSSYTITRRTLTQIHARSKMTPKHLITAEAKANDFLDFVNASPTRATSPLPPSILLTSCSIPRHPLRHPTPHQSRLPRNQRTRQLVLRPRPRREILPHTKRLLHCRLRHWQEMEAWKPHRDDRLTHRFLYSSSQTCVQEDRIRLHASRSRNIWGWYLAYVV